MGRTDDIQPLGASAGRGFYWVRESGSFGGYLRLIAISDTGEITPTAICKSPYDHRAPTQREALAAHLAGGMAQADSALEQRRRNLPEPEPEPEPLDRPTKRFLSDEIYEA